MANQNPDVPAPNSENPGGDAVNQGKIEAQKDVQPRQDNFNNGGPAGQGGRRGGGFGGPRGGRFNNHGGNRRGGPGGGGNFGNKNNDGGEGPGGGGGGNLPFNRGNKRPRGGSGFQGGNQSGGMNDSRDQRGGGGGGGGRNPDERLNDKLNQFSGPTYDLPPIDTSEKKFTGRARLYVGNIAPEVSEDELSALFKKYGETNELFMNKEKNFAFIRLDFHANAEKAKRELDGSNLKGRSLKIRYAPCGSTIKVSNLTPFVSNELLYTAFSIFGEIDRCVINVDDRGKSTGEGIIEFSRKGSATLAIRKCTDDCLFLTASLRPVIVEQYDVVDDTEGYPEKNIHKKNNDFLKEREVGPRFANINSFEHEYGMRWKQLHELYSQKQLALKKELEMEKEKLEAQMEFARYEHETEMLREQLRAREMDRERQKREWEMKERQAEESRVRTEELMRRQQDEMQARMLHQEEELRRRQQENSLFMQAHQLDNMLEQQEQAYDQPNKPGPLFNNLTNEIGKGDVMDSKPFMNNFERNRGQVGPRGGGNMGGRGHWVNEGRGGNDFPNKRRRF